MEIVYHSKKVEKQCTSFKEAKKEFGERIATKLMAKINFIEEATCLNDLIQMTYNFHSLSGKRDGEFAIDVASRRDPYRLILVPLDDEGNRFVPCHIDKIANVSKVVLILEVSKHYE